MGLFDIFGSDAAEKAAAAKSTGLLTGYNTLKGNIDAARDNANVYFDKAAAPFEDLYQRGTAGYNAYSDAAGVNGVEGLGRAGELFKATPGYAEGINMAVDLNDRRAAARGQLGGGNTLADTAKLATDYASQRYGDYVSRLNPYLGASQSAAAGQAGVRSNQAGTNYDAFKTIGDYGYRTYSDIGGANAAFEMDANRASGQTWNAIGNGLKLATSLLGFV